MLFRSPSDATDFVYDNVTVAADATATLRFSHARRTTLLNDLVLPASSKVIATGTVSTGGDTTYLALAANQANLHGTLELTFGQLKTTAASTLVDGTLLWSGGTLSLVANSISGTAKFAYNNGNQNARTVLQDYTGGTIFKSGIVTFTNDNQLGGATAPLIFDGGTATVNTAAAYDAARQIQVLSGGTLNTNGMNVTLSNNIIGTGTLAKNGGGVLTVNNIQGAGLALNAGSVVLPANGNVSVLASLALAGTPAAPTVKFDINDNDLIIQSGYSPAEVLDLVTAGYAAGAWNGNGITSTAAQGNAYHALAVLAGGSYLAYTNNALFNGQTVQATDTLVKYTWVGDANLDGKITAEDYLLLDRGYVRGESGWAMGDFNYDGVIDYLDYAAIDNAALNGGADTTLAQAMFAANSVRFGDAYIAAFTAAVPEPASLTLLAVGALALLRRRRA